MTANRRGSVRQRCRWRRPGPRGRGPRARRERRPGRPLRAGIRPWCCISRATRCAFAAVGALASSRWKMWKRAAGCDWPTPESKRTDQRAPKHLRGNTEESARCQEVHKFGTKFGAVAERARLVERADERRMFIGPLDCECLAREQDFFRMTGDKLLAGGDAPSTPLRHRCRVPRFADTVAVDQSGLEIRCHLRRRQNDNADGASGINAAGCQPSAQQKVMEREARGRSRTS